MSKLIDLRLVLTNFHNPKPGISQSQEIGGFDSG
jgi:hypothetical protein